MQRVLCYIIHYFLTFVIHRCTLQIHPHCGQHTETAVSSRCPELQVFHLASLPMTGTPAPCHHQCCSRHPWACVIRDNVGVLWAADQGQICRPQLCCTQASYPGYISQWFYQSYMRSLKSRFFANTWPHAIPMSTFGLTHVVRIYISLIANELEGFERCLLTLWVFSSLNRLTATFASLFNWDWIFFV